MELELEFEQTLQIPIFTKEQALLEVHSGMIAEEPAGTRPEQVWVSQI